MILFLLSILFPWVVYYGDQISPDKLKPYNPIILESSPPPALQMLLAEKKEILGYVNLGEIETHRPFFSLAKTKGIIIKENKNWPGSFMVDIRSSSWKFIVLEKLIPQVLSQGFSGLFLDQLDIPLSLEEENPLLYQGMKQASIDLVKAIRKRYPKIRIMMNRAYEILPDVGNLIDYELAESLFTNYDFQKKIYFLRSETEVNWQIDQLNKARTTFPHLVLFSMDYWDPSDQKMYEKIYEKAQGHCFRPYISTIYLNEIIPKSP